MINKVQLQTAVATALTCLYEDNKQEAINVLETLVNSGGNKKEKSKKTEAGVNPPKRTGSAYNRFISVTMHALIDDPAFQNGKIRMQEAVRRWSLLSTDEKTRLRNDFNAEKSSDKSSSPEKEHDSHKEEKKEETSSSPKKEHDSHKEEKKEETSSSPEKEHDSHKEEKKEETSSHNEIKPIEEEHPPSLSPPPPKEKKASKAKKESKPKRKTAPPVKEEKTVEKVDESEEEEDIIL